MKLFIVAAVLGVCLADRLENKYLPPRGNSGAGYDSGFGLAPGGPKNNGLGGGFGAPAYRAPQGGFAAPQGGYVAPQGGYSAPQGGYSAPQGGYNAPNSRPQDAGAQILRLNSDVTAEGFSYDFETSNGIRADASGVATNGVQSQGSFAYKGDDGQDYSIQYTADENGYQPRGAHLPTPPPIPEAILKSLEQNARDEAAGIVDDGTYRGEGAGSGGYAAPSGAGAYSGAASGAGGYSGGRPFGSGSSAGAAASRQYLAPNRGSGNGNFNAQSGYQY